MIQIPHTLITRLVVKNYRSLADVDITLNPLTVFVGENGTGKSNLIDVLRFVRDALSGGLEFALMNRGGLDEVRYWYADLREPVSIHLYFKRCPDVKGGPTFSGDYRLAFTATLSGDVVIKSERLFIAYEQGLLLEAVDGKLIHFPDWLEGIEMRKLYDFEFPLYQSTLFLPQLAHFSTRVQAVRHFLANMNFYDISPDDLRHPQKIAPPFPLHETGTNLASTLRALKKTRSERDIVEGLGVVIEGFQDYSIERLNGSYITKLHYAQNGRCRTSDLLHQSDGTIRMLAILTALYQNRDLSPLILEAPEKAIYPRTVGMLSDVLEEIAMSYQLLITTHSSDLIDKFSVDSLRIVEKEDGATKIGPLESEQQKIIAEALFLPGELMQIEGLFREGATLMAKV